MMLDFNNIVDLISDNFFGGSDNLAALAIMVAIWAICLVICMNAKASPAYSVVPMIPVAIFFAAYDWLNSTIMIVIILVSAALVASEFKKVVD